MGTTKGVLNLKQILQYNIYIYIYLTLYLSGIQVARYSLLSKPWNGCLLPVFFGNVVNSWEISHFQSTWKTETVSFHSPTKSVIQSSQPRKTAKKTHNGSPIFEGTAHKTHQKRHNGGLLADPQPSPNHPFSKKTSPTSPCQGGLLSLFFFGGGGKFMFLRLWPCDFFSAIFSSSEVKHSPAKAYSTLVWSASSSCLFRSQAKIRWGAICRAKQEIASCPVILYDMCDFV